MESIDPEIVSQPEVNRPKQLDKKSMISPTKVLIGVAIFLILAMASYKVYTTAFPSKT